MKIKILGDACSSCMKTVKNVQEAIKEIDDNIELETTNNIIEILKHKVRRTPALIIENEIVSEGKDLSMSEAKAIIMSKIKK